MNYEIKITEHKRPLPYVVFEDEKYDLLGEFLLAERSFRRDILAVANDDAGSEESADFSGNAFSGKYKIKRKLIRSQDGVVDE